MQSLRIIWLGTLVLVSTSARLTVAAETGEKSDPTGTWKWERTFGDNTIQFTLRLKLEDDKVSGTYASHRNETTNESKIEDAKLQGDQLSFRVDREFNDRKFTIKLRGKVSDDKITGSGEFSVDGNTREFEWVANRSVDQADVIGTWQMRIETPNGDVREPTVTFSEKDGKLKGVYVGRSQEREAKNIEIKNNQLQFEISGENNGNQWKVTYKGKPLGNSIKGTIDFDFGGNTGSVDFVGKRASEKTKEDGAEEASE